MKKHLTVFLVLLLVTSLLVAGAGMAIRRFLLEPLGIERQEHVISLPFVLMADEILQGQIERKLEQANTPPTQPTETQPVQTLPHGTQEETAPSGAETQPQTQPETQPATEPTVPPTTEPVYTAVDESWFDDVLFIGDSRTTGLKGLGRLGEADYFCAGSVTVYGIQDIYLSDYRFSNSRLATVLENKTYGKIYIHLGLNELIAGADAIMVEYLDLIDMIRQYQPDAYIILMSCMSITPGKASAPNFPIEELHKLNEMLRQHALSDPEVFRFCDVNSWAADEDGYLRQEITCDGSHLYGVYYEEWSRWILEDAGWYNIP